MKNPMVRFAAIIALAMPLAAQAVPVVLGDGDIQGLDVGGASYDVEWVFGSTNPGAGDFALFTGNQAFATQFMNAVLAAFNAAGFTGASGQQFYGVDYANLTGVILQDIGASFILIDSPHQLWGSFSDAGWGRVTRSVPEPGSLSLLGLALIGLGLSARRRSR